MEKAKTGRDGNDDKKVNKDEKENGEKDNEKSKEKDKKGTKTPKTVTKSVQNRNSTTPASQKRSEGVKSEKAIENQKI
jgi:hypothetical protein